MNSIGTWGRRFVFTLVVGLGFASGALAQSGPSAEEIAGYDGLHAAEARGDLAAIDGLIDGGTDIDARDAQGRTPLIVATYLRKYATVRSLIAAGADINALENSCTTC